MSQATGSKFRVILDKEQNLLYNRKWEKKFKWLAASDKGNEHYYCKVCKRHNYGGLRQITLHCTTKTHMKALADPPPDEASVYFVERELADPRTQTSSVTPKKRRISKSRTPPENDSEEGTEEGSPENAYTSSKSELIQLKTYTSPVDGKKIVLGIERRLEPLNKPKTKVIRQAVAPYSRTSETTAAVKTIEQAEAGLLIEEEQEEPVHSMVTVKSEGGMSRNATPSSNANRSGTEQRLDSDGFGVFGKHVANKLRTLTSGQNKFAQKLIMDVLFEGEMETLDRNTKVIKCGVASCVCQQ